MLSKEKYQSLPIELKKGVILKESPLTRTFIEYQENPEWSRQLYQLIDPIGKALQEDLGNDFVEKVIRPLTEVHAGFGIFKKGDMDERTGRVGLVIAMGYEIGDYEKTNIVRPEIVAKLLWCGWFKTETFVAPEAGEKILDTCVASWLHAGVYFKIHQNSLGEFGKFIEGLNLENI